MFRVIVALRSFMGRIWRSRGGDVLAGLSWIMYDRRVLSFDVTPLQACRDSRADIESSVLWLRDAENASCQAATVPVTQKVAGSSPVVPATRRKSRFHKPFRTRYVVGVGKVRELLQTFSNVSVTEEGWSAFLTPFLHVLPRQRASVYAFSRL